MLAYLSPNIPIADLGTMQQLTAEVVGKLRIAEQKLARLTRIASVVAQKDIEDTRAELEALREQQRVLALKDVERIPLKAPVSRHHLGGERARRPGRHHARHPVRDRRSAPAVDRSHRRDRAWRHRTSPPRMPPTPTAIRSSCPTSGARHRCASRRSRCSSRSRSRTRD